MNNFLERVNSISVKALQAVKEWVKLQHNLLLVVISLLGYLLDYPGIAIGCAFIYFAPIVKKLIGAKVLAHRIEYYDAGIVDIVEKIIKESIEEYWVYHFLNQSGDIHHVNEEQENEMVSGVIDIVIGKINDSVIYDKARLHYGILFEEQLAVKISMAVTNFVVEVNGAPREKRKKRLYSQPEKKDMSKFLQEIGIGFNEK